MADGKYSSPEKNDGGSGGFAEFLYNPRTGQVLGRTGISWAKITVFYICFFAGLAAFFALMYFVFYSFLDLKQPRWLGKDGLIGGNPGVGFRPSPDQDKYPESTLIWISAGETDGWGKDLKGFVEKYNKTTGSPTPCDFSTGSATPTTYCRVPFADTPECSEADMYGFGGPSPTPCIVIKLNKIFGWTPEPYTAANLADAKEMPAELQARIRDLSNSTHPDHKQLQTVWISCEGENPGDREAIGEVKYYAPGVGEFPGIPNYYFPYNNQPGYQAPYVFVKFTRPRMNALIQVECKGWAHNIKADRQMRLGSTHFELMIDGGK